MWLKAIDLRRARDSEIVVKDDTIIAIRKTSRLDAQEEPEPAAPSVMIATLDNPSPSKASAGGEV